MNCKDVQRCVHAFIDHELEPEQILQIQAHLTDCPQCRRIVEFEQWFKLELQETVGKVSAPSSLSDKLRGSMAQEERRHVLKRALPKIGLVAALAAGIVAALTLPGFLDLDSQPPPEMVMPTVSAQSSVIDYAAERHTRRFPMEVTGPDINKVAVWYRDKMDFAVHPPQFSDQVQLVGGRISYVENQPAAHLVYNYQGRPITLVVFQVPNNLPMGGAQPLQVKNNTVFMGQSRGYNIAVWNKGGVSYAATSDLNRNDMIQLISAAY